MRLRFGRQCRQRLLGVRRRSLRTCFQGHTRTTCTLGSTADYLRRHRRRELSVEQLAELHGYRPGFGPELLAHLRGEIGTDRDEQAPTPVLALDVERGYVVMRFDPKWQARGVYRVDGHRVSYSEQRVGGRAPALV